MNQDFLPPSLKDHRYYQPTEEGSEKEIKDRLKKWWGEDQGATGKANDEP